MILKEIMARTQLIHVIICPLWKPDRNSVREGLLCFMVSNIWVPHNGEVLVA